MELKKINIDKEKIVKYVAENKKKLLIGAGIIIVLVMALVIFKVRSQSEQEQNAQNAVSTAKPVPLDKTYNYLPATKRTLKDLPHGQDPFSGAMTLQGIITGGGDGDLAIIQAEGTVYVVSRGMSVADVWQVQDISKSTATLKAGNKNILLKFGSRTMVPQVDSEQQSTGNSSGQASGTAEKPDGSSTKEGGSSGG